MAREPFKGREEQRRELLRLSAPHRVVVVAGAPGSGRSWLVRWSMENFPLPSVRVEDIGVAEPAEVTLLRLLSDSLLRERVRWEQLPDTEGDFTESVLRLCVEALSAFPQGVALVVDSARRPLLDLLHRLVEQAPVLVLAVADPGEVPPGACTMPVKGRGLSRRTVVRELRELSPAAMELAEDLASLASTGPLHIPNRLLHHYSARRLDSLIGQHLQGIRFPASLAAEITRRWSTGKLRKRAVATLTRLIRANLGTPELIDRHPWTFTLAAGRLLSLSDSEETRALVRSLVEELERRGSTAELTVLWRCGGPKPFSTAPPERRLAYAVAKRESGDLRTAARLLATIPEPPRPDGWLLHTRAAVACDRGDLRGVGPLLRRAIEAHQVAGDRTGEAWAMLHYGRWRLLSGDFDEAEKVIDSAGVAFQDLREAEGVAWAEAEQARLALLLGASGFPGDSGSPVAEQPRVPPLGRPRSWSHLFTALSRTPAWRGTADTAFPDRSDQLGIAWAWHYEAIQVWRPSGTDFSSLYDESDDLLRNSVQFSVLDCPHGEAWACLERGVRGPRHSFVRARTLFESIGDEAGLAWVDVSEALAFRGDPPLKALRELSRRYPPALLAAIEWPWDHGRFRIPFAARLLIPEPRYPATALNIPSTRSTVLLTLADDDTRLTLQVVPGPNHPWKTAPSLPWLSARATPLTPADIEPDHAVTIRPGPRDDTDAGAEFRFTPHRPGLHRIRFTVEHQLTGTVLQEVEAEFEVTDTGGADLTGTTPTSLGRT